jgi:hypothetical protein
MDVEGWRGEGVAMYARTDMLFRPRIISHVWHSTTASGKAVSLLKRYSSRFAANLEESGFSRMNTICIPFPSTSRRPTLQSRYKATK